MLKSGMVSVTFRNKTPEEIIAISAKAKIDAIEWGSDVHVLPGDMNTAKAIYEKTVAAGLEVASYGSYYRLGEGHDFQAVLDSAVALHAPNIRIWAGAKPSAEATEDDWARMVNDASNISDIAAKESITISLEYHAHTLTDTLESTLRLLSLVPAPNFFTYWQQPVDVAPTDQLNKLLTLLKSGKVSNIHVFQRNSENKKVLLIEGLSAWETYIGAIKNQPEFHYALLEFAADNDEDSFLEDSKILNLLKDNANK